MEEWDQPGTPGYEAGKEREMVAKRDFIPPKASFLPPRRKSAKLCVSLGMKTRLLYTLAQLVFWIGSGWLITSSFSIMAHEIEMIDGQEVVRVVRDPGLMRQTLMHVGLSLALFYGNLWLMLRLHHDKQKTAIAVVTLFLSGLALVYANASYQISIATLALPPQLSYGIVVFYLTISTASALTILWLRNEKRQQQLVVDKKQAELNLLRNQLQPHFLFNALNNMLSMVRHDENPNLSAAFERLSMLLRHVIEESSGETVTIEKEIAFLKHYIELQLLRFSPGEVTIDFDVEGEFNRQHIEPGLFIAFVENAFKYGTEPENKASIRIHFDLTRPDEVMFEIKNKVLMQSQNGTGTGLENTRKRLELIYPGKHQLSIHKGDDFSVELKITTE